MAVLNEYNILEEITVFLRNKDILSVTERGVTTTTDNFTANGVATLFALTNSSNVKNVRTVVLNGSTQTNYSNYTMNYEGANAGKLQFSTTVANNSTFSVNYDYGTDKIYPDFPRADLDTSSYPRIAVTMSNPGSSDFDVGATATLNAPAVTITVFDHKQKGVMDKITAIRNEMNASDASFYNFVYIRPIGTSVTFTDPNRSAKVEQKSINYELPYNVENK